MIDNDILRITFDKAKQLSDKLNDFLITESYRELFENMYEFTEMDLFVISCRFLISELKNDYGIIIDLDDEDLLSQWSYMEAIVSILACVQEDALTSLFKQDEEFKDTFTDALNCPDIPEEEIFTLFLGSCLNNSIGNTDELQRIIPISDYIYSTHDFVVHLNNVLETIVDTPTISNDTKDINNYTTIVSIVQKLKTQMEARLKDTYVPVDPDEFNRKVHLTFNDILQNRKLYAIANTLFNLQPKEDKSEEMKLWRSTSWYLGGLGHQDTSDRDTLAIIEAAKETLISVGFLDNNRS